MAILFAILLLIFGIAAINQRLGNFTINLNYDRGIEGIWLYDNAALENPMTSLLAAKVKELYNITYSDIEPRYNTDGSLDTDDDARILDTIDGAHNYTAPCVHAGGDTVDWYLGYTFYACNYEHDSVTFDVRINLNKYTKNAQQAIRVLVIQDSEYFGVKNMGAGETGMAVNAANKRVDTVYAAPAMPGVIPPADRPDFHPDDAGLPEGQRREPDNYTGYGRADKNFATENMVFEQTRTLTKGQVFKYTVIIYLEGEDPQCVDSIIGGSVRLGMQFRINEVIN